MNVEPFYARPAFLISLVALGIVLRLWQYLADTSMWFDELSIARNISERSLPELLTRPLGFAQTAPLGFLAATDIASSVFGPSDLALRAFPMLCGIVSVLLFWHVAKTILVGIATPLATALFVISAPLIRYSAELKQYGGDVVVILGLTLIAFDLCTQRRSVRRCLGAGLLGFVSVLFSQTAVLVLTGLGAALTFRWLLVRDADARRPVVTTVPLWALACVTGLVIARTHTTAQTMAFMHEFWGQRQGFMPLPFSVGHTAVWARDRLEQMFDALSGYPWPYLYVLLAVAGFAVLWRQRRDVALILLGPLVVTFGAAVAQQYPIRLRLALFLLPSLLLSAAAAVGWIFEKLASRSAMMGAVVLIAALVPPIASIALKPPPYTIEAFKPVLAYVQAHRQNGDPVYVYANAYQAVARYGASYGIPAGSYVVGVCSEHDYRAFYRDIDRFRGARRLWVVASSVPSFAPARQALHSYLQTIGTRKDSLLIPSTLPMSPVSAELFDLSDTVRLRSANAATFQAKADTGSTLCFDWIRPTTKTPPNEATVSPPQPS